VFEPATVDTIRPMLVDVVDTGTGRRAAIPGFSVAGKTSTAEHPVDREHHTCSFVGFAPASRPEVLVLVVVDRPTKNGRFGGEVAAPAAKEILARSLVYLGVQPDRDPETGAR
jgi:cell division protein FtsI/penicillin-binding protein 2